MLRHIAIGPATSNLFGAQQLASGQAVDSGRLAKPIKAYIGPNAAARGGVS
jgi:hypothetical protein